MQGILSDDICFENNTAWFFGMMENALMEWNLDTGVTKYLCSVPNEKNSDFRTFGRIRKFNNYIVLIPDIGKSVMRYNLDTGDIDSFEMFELEIDRFDPSTCVMHNNKIFCLSLTAKKVLIYDVLNPKASELKSLKMKDEDALGWQIEIVDNTIYIPVRNQCAIISYDINNGMINKIILGQEKGGFSCIKRASDNLILAGTCRKIVYYNFQQRVVSEILEYPEKCDIYANNYSEIIHNEYCIRQYRNSTVGDLPYVFKILNVDSNIFLIPYYSDKILLVREKQISVIRIVGEEEDIRSISSNRRVLYTKYCLAEVNDRKEIILLSNKTQNYIRINPSTLEHKAIDNVYIEKKSISHIKSKNVVQEGQIFNLEVLIEDLANS